MLRWVVLVLAAVGLLVALGGCTRSGGRVSSAITPEPPATFTGTPASRAYPERMSRWLSGVPCRAPCWEGITPGVTAEAESLELLRANQFIDQAQFPTAQSAGEIDWSWADSEFGMGIMRSTGGTVSMILVDLPEDVILGDVLGAYGEPSHIVAASFVGDHGDGPFYILSLAWEAHGFALESGSLYTKKPILGPDLGFRKLYFSQSQEGILPGLAEKEALQPWQGFKDFNAYCRDESGQPCS